MEAYLSQFDVEKLEMASVMGICAGLVGPKIENMHATAVRSKFLEALSPRCASKGVGRATLAAL